MAKDKEVGFLKSIIKLEVGTPFGKWNLGTTALLVFCAICYFGSDTIKQLIFVTSSTIKSCYLKQDISQSYNETNYLMLVSPALIVTILCLGYMAWYQHHLIYNTKNKDNDRMDDDKIS